MKDDVPDCGKCTPPLIIPDIRPGVDRIPDHVPGNPCVTPDHVDKVCKIDLPCAWIDAVFKHCCKQCRGGKGCLKHRRK